jgi:phosphoglycolate phosphatase-like HAD superfamily hydrolase
MLTPPNILAFDFDGVLCDGLAEYFQSAWKAYCQVWQLTSCLPPSGLEDTFARLRPVIETGWEMPLLIDALLQGIDESLIQQDWPKIAAERLSLQQLDAGTLAKVLDQVRDRAIQDDVSSWLALHRFYPEVLSCLRSLTSPNSPTHPVIISTKEGRFIRQLLAQQGIVLASSQIYGKEACRPKSQILRELLAHDPQSRIWFVEDRLQTLLSIQAFPELTDVRLYLATWGYNTAQERLRIASCSHLYPLTLSSVVQHLTMWPTHNANDLQVDYQASSA